MTKQREDIWRGKQRKKLFGVKIGEEKRWDVLDY
jgi:hypothetical protein